MKRLLPWRFAVCPLAVIATVSPAVAADMRTLNRELFRGMATQAMRVHRFANIGVLCGLLPPDDAAAIHTNADAMTAEARSLIDSRDADWATAYTSGLQDGAMRSADLVDVVDEASCGRFAVPGGPLDRVLTWTGKPPKTVKGIMMSPRMVP